MIIIFMMITVIMGISKFSFVVSLPIKFYIISCKANEHNNTVAVKRSRSVNLLFDFRNVVSESGKLLTGYSGSGYSNKTFSEGHFRELSVKNHQCIHGRQIQETIQHLTGGGGCQVFASTGYRVYFVSKILHQ